MTELAVAGDGLSKAKDLLQTFGLGQAAEAQRLVQEHLTHCRANGDKDGEVEGLKVLIDVHLAKKEFDEALQVADQAVGVPDDKSKKAKAMCFLAQIHLAKQEDSQEAMSVLAKARSMYKEAGDQKGEVEVLGMIGQMHLGTGSNDMALKVAREALDLDPEAAGAKHILAQVHLANANPTAAIEEGTEMLRICRSTGNKSGEASASLVLATAMLSVDPASSEGLQCAREALALFNEAGDIFGTQSSLHALANGYFARGDLEEGLKCGREALACFRQTGDKMNEESLKATIEQARVITAEYRKQVPKRPPMMPAGGVQQPPAGPMKCPIAESSVPKEMLDFAVAGRKYWGVPTQVQSDPTIDAIDRAPTHSIIWAMNLSDNSATQVCVEFGDLVGVMAKGDVAKIPIVVLTCGVYGRLVGEHTNASITNVSAATIWGMARTVRQEIPQVIIQLLDFSEAMTSAQIPRCLRPPVGESAYYLGARWEPQMVAVSSLFRRDLKRDNLTGGGGGGQDTKKAARFMRKSFNWTGPSHKLDFCWYRQEWRAVGPPTGPEGPMPPPPPCRAMRTY